MYAVGGFNGSLRVRTVDAYDPVKDAWSAVSSMEARRSTLGAAILNGLIYAVGGFDGSSGELTHTAPPTSMVVTVVVVISVELFLKPNMRLVVFLNKQNK